MLTPAALPLLTTSPQVTFNPEFFLVGFIVGIWVRYLFNRFTGAYHD